MHADNLRAMALMPDEDCPLPCEECGTLYGRYPIPDGMPALAGLFVGGCVARGIGSRFRAQAHAHTERGDWQGWVCILAPRRVYMADGRPSRLLWHEYAHIVSGHGHDDYWRMAMRDLRQPLPRRYRRRPRGDKE